MTCISMNKPIDLIFEKNLLSHDIVVGDPTRLRQIIINLCDNAIKFTHQGKVEVKVTLLPSDNKKLKLSVQVRDTGIGISKDQLNKLFQPFTQANSSTTRQFGGTGLGLTISQQLCHLMDGHLTVTSEPGKGSCFSFDIMLEEHTPIEYLPTIEKKSAEELSGKNVLIVEDNYINQVVASNMLEEINLTVEVAENGIIAINKLSEHREAKYHLILMDCQMSELDGYETTQKIRNGEAGECYKNIPIVAMTANAMSEDKQKCIAAGMVDYISKPVSRVDFDRITQKYLVEREKSCFQ